MVNFKNVLHRLALGVVLACQSFASFCVEALVFSASKFCEPVLKAVEKICVAAKSVKTDYSFSSKPKNNGFSACHGFIGLRRSLDLSHCLS